LPIIPNFIERLVLIKLNLGPGMMLDILGAVAFPAITCALKLGVFETLNAGPMTTKELARKIEGDERGTTILLEALESLGYVRKKKGRWSNSAMTAKWLLGISSNNLASGFAFSQGLLERMNYLSESIRLGKPYMSAWDWFDQHPDGWRDYQAAMLAMARMVSDDVVPKVKIAPNARRLLDVGGGHGLYSIKFCQRNPNLSATVFDWPQSLNVARDTVDIENMSSRVMLQEGDFWKDDIGNDYDVALLFNIIHGFSPEKNTMLFRKVASALNSGGQIVIMDQLAGKVAGPTAKAVTRLQGLNLFNEVGGQTYAYEEIAQWLMTVGFSKTRRINLRKTPGFGLVLGNKVS